MADLTRRVVIETLWRNQIAGELAAFRKQITSITGSFTSVGRSVLAFAGVGGLGYMIKKQMDAIDSTAKLSDRLGIGTEALIGLQHGANLAGVEQETLNRSMEVFSRKLGEMQMGGTGGKEALDQLGLSYKDLVDKSPDEAIGIVADQINKLQTQSQKAAAANYLFGKSGHALLNLFSEGSKGIAAYRLETEKLGLSFSRVDAGKVEAANDALTRMRDVFTGVFRQSAIELAPYIEAATSSFVEFATQGEGLGKNVADVFESIALGIGKTIEETERLILKLNQLASPIDTARKATDAFLKARERYKAEPNDTRERRFEILREERQKAGLEPEDQESRIRKEFDKIRQDAQKRAAAKTMGGPARTPAGITEAAPAWFDTTDDLQKQLAKEAQVLMEATGAIDEKMAKMSLSARDYKIRLIDDEIEKYRQAGVEKGRLDEFKLASIEAIAKEEAESRNKVTVDIAAAYVRMYDDIDSKTAASYSAREKLLMEEYNLYAETIQDKALLDEWLRNKQEKLAIDKAKGGGDFFAGVRAGITEMKRELPNLGQLGADLGVALREGVVGSLSDAVFEARDLGEAMKEVARSMAKMAFEFAARNLMTGVLSAAIGGAAAGAGGGMIAAGGSAAGGGNPYFLHSGGIAGIDGLRKPVPPGTFFGAPRFHLGSDEVPAILQRGERVIAKGQTAGPSLGGNTDRLESLLGQMVGLLKQRQTINANVIDKRDVVTRGRMEGREGEKWTMYHVGRNG